MTGGMKRLLRNPIGLLISCLFLTININSYSQTVANGLLKHSVDPHGDSLFFAETRARMDSIRKAEGRPTIALVLAGGGAKGAASIGVIKYLEEMDIPIDLVSGTSIGGILGALYAVGYTADEMHEIISSQDWDAILNDSVDKKYIPQIVKAYKDKHILTVQFDFGKKNSLDKDDRKKYFRESLPSGMIEGFNVNKMLSSLTVGYHDDRSFAELPIPYICTAGDLTVNKEKNFHAGDLVKAMRSTMAIPGLFNPVEYESRVLVDGGVRNNIPVDLAKAMGADYTIVISLVQESEAHEKMNIANIAGSLLTLLTYDTVDDSRKMSDIFINPELKGFGMLSFNAEAVDEMYKIGYETAKGHQAELLELKKITGSRKSTVSEEDKAVNLSSSPVKISGMSFRGIDAESAEFLKNKVLKVNKIIKGNEVSMNEIEEILNRLKASGNFEDISFSLYGPEDPYELVFHCKPAVSNRFGFGGRIDNQDWVQLMLNFGINTNSLKGHSLDINANIGHTLSLSTLYTYKFVRFPSLNLEASVSRVKPDFFVPNTDPRLRMKIGSSILGHTEKAYFNLASSKYFQFNGGLMYRSFTIDEKSELWNLFYVPDYEISNTSGFMGLFLHMNFENLDNKYFPTKGQYIKALSDWEFFTPSVEAFRPILSVGVNYKGAFSFGKAFTLLPELNVSAIMNGDQNYSIFHNNYFGGEFAGRYMEQQVPYFGINGIAMSEPILATFSLESRVKVYKKIYASLLLGMVKQAQNFKDFTSSWKHDFYSLGAQLSYDSFIGPIKLNYHYTNGIGSEVYFSLGYYF